ncbi:cytosine permease [Fructobacillus sp. CRL 2054]|uniref:cytosine permease n=1 Tax=Fructobacillus sp. CRL 2054 TaxID=2763007 RepID=UPI0023792B44|nr:cytosine permease [Fructobacillus sp. CRL 2054]MDD9138803.1 cytosine permease [Fructobacillus sp. CRL 2054]
MDNQKHYRVRPIPAEERNLGKWDMFATWFGANANNGTWYIGGIIAACGMIGGLWALLIASILSYIFLSFISFMGYKTGLSTTTLSRATFGIRGSIIPSMINFIMFMGWTAVNTFIAATSLSFIFHSFFGWPVYGQAGGNKGLIVGILIMSALHIMSIISGQKSVRIIERIGILLVIFFVLWEGIVVFRHVSFNELVNWVVPAKDRMQFGAAIDILAAFNLAWVTSAADFSRFAKTKTVSTVSSFWGALVGVVAFAAMGLSTAISIALTTGIYKPDNSDPSTVANELGLGTIAMIVIVLTSMTANAVNLQAAGSALNNIFSKISLRNALLISTIIATIFTFIPVINGDFLADFTAFLDYIGMFLGPIIAIMIVDYFLLHKADYQRQNFEKSQGRFWFKGGYNFMVIALWVVGVLMYLYLSNVEFLKDTTGATFLVMVVIGVVYYALVKLTNRSGEAQ